MSKTLITNATIVSMDPAIGLLSKGAILIEDGILKEVAPTVSADDAEIVDAEGMVAIPGLINAHIHMWQTAVRGFGVDWTGVEHHLHMQSEFVPVYTPEDIKLSEYFGALNLMNGGVTTVYEWCHGNRTPDHSDGAIEGLKDAGIRSIFIHGTVKTLPMLGEAHFSQVPHPRKEAERLRRIHSSDDALLTLALGILGPDYAPLEVCRQDFALAEDLNLWSSAHAHGKAGGKVEGGYVTLEKEGILTARHNAVHMTSVSDEALKILIDKGCSITATSQTEISGGGREPMIRRVEEMGGAASIGTDSEANSSADMLEAMRWSLYIQRLFNNIEREKTDADRPAATNAVKRGMDRPAHIKPGSMDALRWATMGNAKAFGMDHKIGSLTPGKRADIVLVRNSGLNVAPMINPADAIVGFANSSNIDTVFVDGRKVKSGGVLTQQAAIIPAATELRQRSERIIREAGLADYIPIH